MMTLDKNLKSCSKILFITPWGMHHIGGVNQVVNNLSVQFHKLKTVDPLVMNSEYGCDEIREELLPSGVPLVHLTLRDPKSNTRPVKTIASFLIHFPKALFNFRHLIKNKSISTVNIHYPGLSSLTVVAATKYLLPRKQLIMSFHGADIHEIKALPTTWKIIWHFMLASIDSAVFCSKALAIEFEQLFPKMRPKIHIIHNGVDKKSLLESANTGKVPKTLQNQKFILNAATFEHKKGQDILIEAFALVANKFPKLNLAIMGRNAESKPDLITQVKKLNLQHRILFFEDVPHPDVLAAMKEAEVFVLPSRLEPFGIVMLEAAVFNTPVIASRTGGIKEVIKDGHSGILVKPEDINELAQAIIKAVKGGPEIDLMASNLNNSVDNTFTWQQAASRYLELSS